jgi:antitoxin VapB
MGVQLNIKSEEARRLAERLAYVTGRTITDVVTDSLRRELRQVELEQALGDEALRDREHEFYNLISGTRARWRSAMLSIDHADLLYDEDGLPQ